MHECMKEHTAHSKFNASQLEYAVNMEMRSYCVYKTVSKFRANCYFISYNSDPQQAEIINKKLNMPKRD